MALLTFLKFGWGPTPSRLSNGAQRARYARGLAYFYTGDLRKAKEDLELYQKHPEHLKVAEFIGKARERRAVVDYHVD